ncbi:PREDICTED: trithorax group protein osa-like [Lipotes vexillifer]|uniref:Trithorax group protein osa-like n=1 Tax=Lipotes vexillifer TaxID=118797 RepID=A0A340XIP1_LIPVE|nr:PREDICTED: trithorax group protein osa-like [Lipotes vexillifer]
MGPPESCSQRPQNPAPPTSGQAPAPGPSGPWSHPPAGQHTNSRAPSILQPETLVPSSAHQQVGTSPSILSPDHQRTGTSLGAASHISGQAPAPGPPWAPAIPRVDGHQPQDRHSPAACHGRTQPTFQQASTSPGTPWAPALSTSRPTPALRHLGPLSQPPWDLVPPTSRPIQGLGHPRS